MHLSCFKAYDVRGKVPAELDETLAYRIGWAYAAFLSPSRVVVGAVRPGRRRRRRAESAAVLQGRG